MAVVAAVERVVHLFAKRLEVILPATGVTKIGIVGEEYEAHFVLQAPQHGSNQVVVLGKEAGIYPYVVNQPTLKRFVQRAVAVAQRVGSRGGLAIHNGSLLFIMVSFSV